MTKIIHYAIAMLAVMAITVSAYGQKPKLKVGKKAPAFDLPNSEKTSFDLKKTLDEGKNVVLVFYQGKWNPYDVKYLKKLQEAKEQIEGKNAVIVLITREKFSYVDQLRAEEGIDLMICNDSDWYIMSAYGVAYKMSKGNLPDKYKSYSASNAKHTGSKDDMVPVPATFVIGTDLKIKYMHFDWDYRQHPPVSEIINSL
ncbi:MAG: hypothetical protein CL840_14130 [Crocinitomicaceae bacterium]|nr:hypothetical protein [Crocinitomicaceae bacterium]|tara:strand:- start:119 stop:715 length:597 start_codon:yes stop_codon:yes gene_type:complete